MFTLYAFTVIFHTFIDDINIYISIPLSLHIYVCVCVCVYVCMCMRRTVRVCVFNIID